MRLPPKEVVFLYFTVCTVNLMTFSGIVTFTWSATTIPRLQEDTDENPLGYEIDSTEESLLASLFFIGSTIGPFLSAGVAQKYGRRITIIIFTIPAIVSLLMKAFANEMWIYYLARMIGGLTGVVTLTTVPIYVAEIAQNHNRGRLAVLLGLFSNAGNLYVYAIGSYISIYWFSLTSLWAPILLCFTVILFVPETPFYWILRNDDHEAFKTLQKFRYSDEKEIYDEIEEIKTTIALDQTNQITFHAMLSNKAFKRSLTITVIGIILQQFSAVYAIHIYLQEIFDASGSNNSPEIDSIIVGLVKVSAYTISIFAADKLGRRFLLLESELGIFISLASIGTYFFLQDRDVDVSAINWLPLASLLLFEICFCSGVGCIPFVQIGEMFPQNVKGKASIIVITLGSILSFVITLSFPNLADAIGLGPTFWIFSISGIIGCIYTYMYVPETKGKSFAEIQDMLSY